MISSAIPTQELSLPAATIIIDEYSDQGLVSQLQRSLKQLTGQDIAARSCQLLTLNDLNIIYMPLGHAAWWRAPVTSITVCRNSISSSCCPRCQASLAIVAKQPTQQPTPSSMALLHTVDR